MNKYKIVYVKDNYIDFINDYPNIIKSLLIEEKSMFDSKQLNLIFDNNEKAKDYFKRDLFLREDYYYFHGIHKLENSITNKNITFIMNQYDIEVHDCSDNYIIFEYLKSYSSNFFMFNI